MLFQSIKYLFLTLCCLWLFACEDCTFTSKNSSEVAVKFFLSAQDTEVRFDSILTSKGGHIFYINDRDEQSLYLPETSEEILTIQSVKLSLNPASDSSAFIFYWADRKDTLEVIYERQIEVITPDCGFDQRIDHLQVIKNTFPIDSILVVKPHLQINDDNNVEIYLSE